MQGQADSGRIGEVVEASSTSFLSQCYRLYEAPPLGALVRAGKPGVYGVVCRVVTEPLDAGRPVLARGEDAATEEEVFRSNPQLERLLTSRFESLVLGHQDSGSPRPVLPPIPPRVHAFVHLCEDGEAVALLEGGGWLRSLLSSNIPTADQVAVALLRRATGFDQDSEVLLMESCRELAWELAGDLPRLSAILKAVRQ